MSGGNAAKGKARSSRRQEGWEEAGGEFYQESYPGGAEQEMLDNLQQADANKLATLLPSKLLRAATVKRVRSQNERRQSTFARTVASRDVNLSMLPDLSENLSNEERTWEEMMQIKSMPVPMAQKLELKAQLQNATRLRLVGVAALAWRRRVAWHRVRARVCELLRALEPWRAHLNTIEGHFGTGIAAYFLFLRWLLALNLSLSLLVLAFVMVPASVLERAPRACDESGEGAWNDTACCSEQYSHDAIAELRPLDIVQGTGAVEHTLLFYGFYSDQVHCRYTLRLLEGVPVVSYDMPLAYMCVMLCVFAVSLAAIVRSAASGARERLVESEGHSYRYCSLVFAGWDYCVRSEKSAAIKHEALYNEIEGRLQEEKWKEEKRQRSGRERAFLLLVRVLINLLVVVILATAAVAIYAACDYSERRLRPQETETRRNVTSDAWHSPDRLETLALEFLPSACIVLLNAIVPELFSSLARAERYTPAFVVRVTLSRTVLLRLSSLGVLLGQMYETVTAREPASCAPAALDRLPCWETYVGQQLYKLALANFVVQLVVTFVVDFPRAWVARRVRGNCLRRFGERKFDLPKHVLDAVYAQSIVWLGAFYCPALPPLGALLGFLGFYVKRFACVVNSTPSSVAYRASRSKSTFMFVLLLSYAMAAVPVAYSVAELRPSLGCGPFRGLATAWTLLADYFLSMPEPLRRALELPATAMVATPAFAVAMLLLYYYWAVAVANRHMVRALKSQLVLEGHDKQFLLDRLGAFIRQHQKRCERIRTRTDADTD